MDGQVGNQASLPQWWKVKEFQDWTVGAKENIQLVLGMITTLDYLTQINIEEITGSQFGELWIIFGGDPGKAHDLTTPFLPTGTLLVQPTQQRGSSTFTSLSSIPS